jgi:autotransporter strand-loop-strand O-heptosyltransferase
MEIKNEFLYNMYLIDGLYFELFSTPENKPYTVKLFDGRQLQYESEMIVGSWSKTNRQYLSDYIVEIWDDGKLVKKINYLDNLEGKKIFISIDSNCLGDTIAWIPYCLEFKKFYKCDVIVSTSKNFLFKNVYPELEFVPRNTNINNIYGAFKIGWYYDKNKEPDHPATIPLQKTICNILRIPYKEIKARIFFKQKKRPIQEKYITIATQSTAQCKLWYHWTELIDYLSERGYKVVEVSLENVIYKNLINPKHKGLQTTMNYIHHSELFIGLSSGLSWLAWCLDKHVVMISNFSKEGHEFISNCTRITNQNVCHGCWNDPNFKFDKSDWDWCPINKDSDKSFECHTSISSEMVINVISSMV